MTRRLVVPLLMAMSMTAHADDTLLRRALERYADADFQGSIQLLLQAVQGTRDPKQLGRIHLHMGVNHEVLGDAGKAVQSFKTALSHDPVLELDPKQFRTSAVVLFKKAKLAMELRVSPPAPSTMPASSPAATPSAPALAQTQPASAPALAQTQPRAAFPEKSVVKAADVPTSRGRIWTWIAVGGALAAAAAGIGLGVAARWDHDEWDRVRREGTDRERWDALAQSGTRKELAANVLFGVAGALAVASAVLYFLEGRGTHSNRASNGAVSFAVAF